MFAHRFESWTIYKQWHENTLGELAAVFKRKAEPIRELENPPPGQQLEKGTLCKLPQKNSITLCEGYLQTIEYIKAYGIGMLPYCLSVIVTRHKSDPRLCWFNSTKDESPTSTQVVKECSGLLLCHEDTESARDETFKTGNWKIICYPIHRFPSYDWGSKPYYHVRIMPLLPYRYKTIQLKGRRASDITSSGLDIFSRIRES